MAAPTVVVTNGERYRKRVGNEVDAVISFYNQSRLQVRSRCTGSELSKYRDRLLGFVEGVVSERCKATLWVGDGIDTCPDCR